MIVPVILAGGNGTRLWPLSRKDIPKQFLPITHEKTMLQETLSRLNDINTLAVTLICNESHQFVANEQLKQIDQKNCQMILEPFGRDTAPAVALAAFKAMVDYDDPLMLVMPADHEIENTENFQQVILHAQNVAEKGKLVTFGIKPKKAETGYGYIKKGGSQLDGSYLCEAFVEKPNKITAQKYLEEDNYLWNSGMFLFKASSYLNELKIHSNKIYKICKKVMEVSTVEEGMIKLNPQIFAECPSDSIDYAVMEKTSSAVVIPLDNIGWSDVGGFESIWDVKHKDKNKNVFSGDVKAFETNNCLVISEDKLVATVGLENLVIINTKDTLLVVHKDHCQDVKQLVGKLDLDHRVETQVHREVHRPWGHFDGIDRGERYQVKKIVVNPGEQLSLQKHHHRAEHWVVVSGTAMVTNGNREFMLSENESTYIPAGEIHMLRNPGVIPLELIEVQSGSYLGEDDIVRIKDVYGRV
ncbi:MAG: mannose-1-phosphate guanylyltransferase/mannose-6-phosphate isomerase [Saccharospirillaceae bacterium]|nr:mannose-1-phosphate guanylyltransferase/mannose-6-phosphate isomerase [Pseudomonadales bacterium]NRB81213.1 mannose-1-phosphate guanylyltransferase/mannose-6-phosphate isomerase [Saccharospirillaceae bacterium]